MSLSDIEVAGYRRDGFLSPVTVMSPDVAVEYRRRLEAAEAAYGPMHYLVKPHLLLTMADELAHHPVLLDTLESLLGPDLLLWDSAFIVKEPGSNKKVSWHQDLTYWGLDSDEVVSVWLALSPANAESGAMCMVPGSHRQGRMAHREMPDDSNVLSRGQALVEDVDERTAIQTVLAPGQMSLHHGWVFHASKPNTSNDRRIGFNMNVITPRVRQLIVEDDSAMLLRGHDAFGHFRPEPRPSADFSAEGVAFQADIARRRGKSVNLDPGGRLLSRAGAGAGDIPG